MEPRYPSRAEWAATLPRYRALGHLRRKLFFTHTGGVSVQDYSLLGGPQNDEPRLYGGVHAGSLWCLEGHTSSLSTSTRAGPCLCVPPPRSCLWRVRNPPSPSTTPPIAMRARLQQSVQHRVSATPVHSGAQVPAGTRLHSHSQPSMTSQPLRCLGLVRHLGNLAACAVRPGLALGL